MSTDAAVVKKEVSVEPVLTCCLCSASKSDVKLSFINLGDFYNFFKPCGIGSNIHGRTHYNYACSCCARRASQCLQFIKGAKEAERLFRAHLQDGTPIANETPRPPPVRTEPPVSLSAWTLSYEDLSESTCDSDEGSFAELRVVQKSIDNGLKLIKYERFNDERRKMEGRKRTNRKKAPVKRERRDDIVADDGRKDSVATDCSNEMAWSDDESDTKKMTEPPSNGAIDRECSSSNIMEALQLSRAEQLAELQAKRVSALFLGRRYQCHKCAVSFHEKQCIDAHNDLHSEERGSFECDVCTRRFPSKRHLHSHQSWHKNRWRCLRCGVYITTKEKMSAHRAACTSSRPLQCALCKKIYRDSVRLKKHTRRMHMNKRCYTCDICGKTFRMKQLIVNHIRVHTKEKPHQCDVCGKKSATLSSHKRHIHIHQRELVNDPNLYCVECDKYFKDKYILTLHYKNSQKHNSQENFKHKCPDCDERFSIPNRLFHHQRRVHMNVRAHKCSLCDKAYYSNSALCSHVKTKHSGGEQARDKVCNVCGKAFKSGSTLKNHLVVHTRERPFSCLVCSATFTFKAALYTHTKLKHKTTQAEVKRQLDLEGQLQQRNNIFTK